MVVVADEEEAEPSGEGFCRRRRSKDGKGRKRIGRLLGSVNSGANSQLLQFVRILGINVGEDLQRQESRFEPLMLSAAPSSRD